MNRPLPLLVILMFLYFVFCHLLVVTFTHLEAIVCSSVEQLIVMTKRMIDALMFPITHDPDIARIRQR